MSRIKSSRKNKIVRRKSNRKSSRKSKIMRGKSNRKSNRKSKIMRRKSNRKSKRIKSKRIKSKITRKRIYDGDDEETVNKSVSDNKNVIENKDVIENKIKNIKDKNTLSEQLYEKLLCHLCMNVDDVDTDAKLNEIDSKYNIIDVDYLDDKMNILNNLNILDNQSLKEKIKDKEIYIKPELLYGKENYNKQSDDVSYNERKEQKYEQMLGDLNCKIVFYGTNEEMGDYWCSSVNFTSISFKGMTSLKRVGRRFLSKCGKLQNIDLSGLKSLNFIYFKYSSGSSYHNLILTYKCKKFELAKQTDETKAEIEKLQNLQKRVANTLKQIKSRINNFDNVILREIGNQRSIFLENNETLYNFNKGKIDWDKIKLDKTNLEITKTNILRQIEFVGTIASKHFIENEFGTSEELNNSLSIPTTLFNWKENRNYNN
jgi:hypothetical protein